MTQPSLLDLPVSVYVVHEAEVKAEAVRLASAADRVLAALQTGPKTNIELIALRQRHAEVEGLLTHWQNRYAVLEAKWDALRERTIDPHVERDTFGAIESDR